MKNNLNLLQTCDAPLALLGGISPKQFLEEYWHKKPLLIRGAVPAFNGLLSPNELAGLACEEFAQSRLVTHDKKGWHVAHGPFEESDFNRLPKHDWTLLVQGLNHHLPEATALLQQFNFIPHARLDDLMVSYAPDQGGVGPHFDSYDVFLLQGEGKRLWRLSQQDDLALIEDAPMKILQRFHTEEEYVLEPGDMLYLPPKVAHWGIAQGPCMTYSIGFRAPSKKELIYEFLSYLQDRVQDSEETHLLGLYEDADLKPQPAPALIGNDMVEKVEAILKNIHWDTAHVSQFLGQYLSEPKPHIMFEPPKSMTLKAFETKLTKKGIALALTSQMLFTQDQVFMNGELVLCDSEQSPVLQRLANERILLPKDYGIHVTQQLHDWYLQGYVVFEH